MSVQEMQVFEDLTDDETQAIFALFPVLKIPRGQLVVAQGSSDTAVYVVLKGAFDVVAAADGNETRLASLSDGAVFGELSFLDDLPRSASVVASEDAEVLRMDREGFDGLMASQPTAASKLYRDLARVVTRRLRIANEALIKASPRS